MFQKKKNQHGSSEEIGASQDAILIDNQEEKPESMIEVLEEAADLEESGLEESTLKAPINSSSIQMNPRSSTSTAQQQN